MFNKKKYSDLGQKTLVDILSATKPEDNFYEMKLIAALESGAIKDIESLWEYTNHKNDQVACLAIQQLLTQKIIGSGNHILSIFLEKNLRKILFIIDAGGSEVLEPFINHVIPKDSSLNNKLKTIYGEKAEHSFMRLYFESLQELAKSTEEMPMLKKILDEILSNCIDCYKMLNVQPI